MVGHACIFDKWRLPDLKGFNKSNPGQDITWNLLDYYSMTISFHQGRTNCLNRQETEPHNHKTLWWAAF